MLVTNVRRVIRGAFVGFWRNAWVSIATVLVMVLAIFMVGSLVLFQALLGSTLAEVEKKIDVSVYFKIDAPEEEILHIQNLLTELPEVQHVEYVSREAAFIAFKERHSGNALIASALDELGENPLNATLKIRAHSPSDYAAIAHFLEEGSFSVIDKVNYRQNQLIFERLASILSTTRRVGLGVSLVLGFIAFLVAFNTIRLAIFTSREEIGIMRVVGASNWFVRAPFLVEGALYGIVAAVIVMLLFWPVALWIGPKAEEFTRSINLFEYYTGNMLQFFTILVLFGVFLGVFSSFFATRRYLKVQA